MSNQESESAGHEISDETLSFAKKHADVSLRHGKIVERIGREIKKTDLAQGISIEQHGKAIQEHAKASKAYANEAEQHGEASTRNYNLAVEEHVKQSQEHIRAIREYSKILNAQVDKYRELSEKHQRSPHFLEHTQDGKS
jgi:hypothetical protein